VLVALLLLAGAPADEIVSPSETPDGLPGVVATFTVDAPADLVLDRLWDGRYARWIFPQIARRTEIERTPVSVVLEYELKTVIGAMRYRQRNIVERSAAGGGAMRWERLSGDMDVVRGEWLITPLGASRCAVRYTSFVATGPRLFYGFVRSQQVDNTRGVAERVRAVAASTVPP
jgi:hypothetical protein